MRFPERRVEGVGPLGSPTAVALQVVPVAVDEHALEFRPAEHVEAVRSVRLESNEHADEVAGLAGASVAPSSALRPGSARPQMSGCRTAMRVRRSP